MKNRYWKIIDSQWTKQEVKGEGVVGEQPILNPGEKFEYTSGTLHYQPLQDLWKVIMKWKQKMDLNLRQLFHNSLWTVLLHQIN